MANNLNVIPLAQLFVVFMTVLAIYRILKTSTLPASKIVGVVLIWILIGSGLSLSETLSDFHRLPPPFAIVLFFQFAMLIWVIFFSKWSPFLERIPQASLIVFQSFRFGVELILAALATRSLMPQELTYHGINWDILVGLLAVPTAWIVERARGQVKNRMILIWNIFGLTLLANIVIHAFLAAPLPFQVFHYNVDTRIVAEFPYQTLPLLLVPAALAAHLISLRNLFAKKRRY